MRPMTGSACSASKMVGTAQECLCPPRDDTAVDWVRRWAKDPRAAAPHRHRARNDETLALALPIYEAKNLVQQIRLDHGLSHFLAAVGAFIGEVDLRHAPMRCDVLDVHRQARTAWADHEGWFGVVMVDIGRGIVSAPQQGIQLSSPTRKAAYASAAATIMMLSEHRGNDRAFPACVTNLHIIATAHHRSVVRARGCWRSHSTRSGHVERGGFQRAEGALAVAASIAVEPFPRQQFGGPPCRPASTTSWQRAPKTRSTPCLRNSAQRSP